MKTDRRWVAWVLLLFPMLGASPTEMPFRVVGYLPDYRMAQLDQSLGQHLTDLIYFSVEPDAKGGLDRKRLKPEYLVTLKRIKDQHKIKLHLSVGGWGRSAGFPRLAASAELRTKFASELVRFCQENGFDGVDLDWEHPKGSDQVRDHGLLLTEVRRQFRPHGYQLTIAVAGWQTMSGEAIAAVDWFNLMAYDGEGKHSTFEFAQADVARLLKQGIPASKICLGLPFYGRDIKNHNRERTYADLVQKSQSDAIDEIDGYYFNSVATIEKKARFALESKLAGVMIWEVGQDTHDERSLLKAIGRISSIPKP